MSWLRKLCGTAACAVCTFSAGHAQETTSSSQLEAIIVTAERRPESIQNTPITMSAFTGSELEARKVDTTQDLRYLVPTLNYGSEAGQAVPYMRGIGNNQLFPNSDPSVATYLDGVYIANDVGTIVNLLGVDRVEVLVGPQGTLYGNNAIGGTINVITKDPANTPEANVLADIGNYNLYEGRADLSGPIAEGLTGGIYLGGNVQSSITHVYIPKNERDFNGTPTNETWASGRVKLVYEHEWLRLAGSYEHSYFDSMDAGAARNIQPTALGVLLGAPYFPQPYFSAADGAAWVRSIVNTSIIHEDIDLGGLSLHGITGYRDLHELIAFDYDATSIPLAEIDCPLDFSTEYSQELRLQSRPEGKLKWIVGLYAFHERGGFNPTGLASQILFTSFLGPGDWESETIGTVTTTSLAAFGQAVYALTDTANLTLGARDGQDHKELSNSTSQFEQIVGGNLGPPPILVTHYPDLEKTWKYFSPKITIDDKIGDTLVYGTWSRGYQEGIYNLTSTTAPGPVNPERLTDYEIGSKSSFLNNRVHLNLAAYYYHWEDIQIQIVEPGSGGLSIIQNGGDANARGIEASVDALVTDSLGVQGTASFEHGTYDNFPQGLSSFKITPEGNVPDTVQPDGNTMIRAPRWLFTTRVYYTEHLPNGGSLRYSGDWYYNGGFYWEASNQIKQNAYNVFNASITYSNKADSWQTSLWIKNIGNTVYENDEELNSFNIYAVDAPPRTFGINFSKKFKWD